MRHMQITWGHHPEHGWQVVVRSFAVTLNCESREAAKIIHKTLVEAYQLGKNDLRKDIAELVEVK